MSFVISFRVAEKLSITSAWQIISRFLPLAMSRFVCDKKLHSSAEAAGRFFYAFCYPSDKTMLSGIHHHDFIGFPEVYKILGLLLALCSLPFVPLPSPFY